MVPESEHTGDDESEGEADARSVWFLLVAGKGRVVSHEVTKPSLVIGRDPSCDLVIDDAVLSRRHLRLTVTPRISVEDLGSKNGTSIGERTLRGGEAVELGAARGFHVGPYSFVLLRVDSGMASASQRTGGDPTVVTDPTPDGVSSFVRDVAQSRLSVLILGETGVGKEVLAETLHQASGRRGPLCRLNCAAISASLLESELFGHERGAFTGAASAKIGLIEAAQGGTVFLDEVGELPLEIQAKLLRAVEGGQVLRVGSTHPVAVDTRFVSATNRALADEVAAGRFRADLFFRLAGVTFRIPPLRERRASIAKLGLAFLRDLAKASGREPAALGAEALAALEAYDFPGNVRELRSTLERAALLARGGTIEVRHLGLGGPSGLGTPPRPSRDAGSPTKAAAERQEILAALDRYAGNQTRAAKSLGMSRTTFVQRLREYGIKRPRSEPKE